jgi:hypothetical protein
MYVSKAQMAALTGEPIEFRRPVVRSPRLRAALLASAAGRARAEDVLVAAVLDRLRSDLTAAPHVGDLAAEVGLSREHLIRAFTRATRVLPPRWASCFNAAPGGGVHRVAAAGDEQRVPSRVRRAGRFAGG